MRKFQKAKTSKVIGAIITDQQRRRACDVLSIESTSLSRCSSENVVDQSVLSIDIFPNNELRVSNPIQPAASSLHLKNIEFHGLNKDSLECGTFIRKKRFQFQSSKCTKGNEKLPPEFFEGLLVFAPNRRDSLFDNFSESIDFPLDIKETRRNAIVVNLSYPWKLSWWETFIVELFLSLAYFQFFTTSAAVLASWRIDHNKF